MTKRQEKGQERRQERKMKTKLNAFMFICFSIFRG